MMMYLGFALAVVFAFGVGVIVGSGILDRGLRDMRKRDREITKELQDLVEEIRKAKEDMNARVE